MKKTDISDKEKALEGTLIWYCLAPEFSFLITAPSLHITGFKEIVKHVIPNSMLQNFDQVFK